MSVFLKFMRRPLRDRLLLMEALALLLWARLLVWMVPFRWIAPNLGQKMGETSLDTLTSADDATVLRVSWAVEMVASHFPVSLLCLPQAMAAKWLLRRRQVASTLYLGVRNDPEKDGRMLAHAWLRCGPRILAGRSGYTDYTVVATFGNHT